MTIAGKLKLHLWTLPRWFALPFIGGSSIFGSYLAGGDIGNLNTWLAFLVVAFLMAKGHVTNTVLDYYWTGLDRGETKERSAEKVYCGGQNVIEKGYIGKMGLFLNECLWCILALIPAVYLIVDSTTWILPLFLMGLVVAYWYSWGKFNWTHELSLGVACGPVPLLMGMYAVDPSADVQAGLLVSVPFAIILSFAGLALDEYPDAEANLKKGVKSIAYEVYNANMPLSQYLMGWFVALYAYQVWLISSGYLAQWTALTFLLFPFFMAANVFLHKACWLRLDIEFETVSDSDYDAFARVASVIVALGGLYPILLIIGQGIN